TRRPRYALAMFADRGPRLVNLGYFGHMWELYALWTWLPTFLVVSRTTATGLPASASPGRSGIDAFLAIGVAGLAGCLFGGWAARPPRPARPRRRRAHPERRVLPVLAAVLHRRPAAAAGLRGGVGSGGHRRFRRVLHTAQRARRPSLRGNRADRSDGDRVPADHPHNPADSPAFRGYPLAPRLCGSRPPGRD